MSPGTLTLSQINWTGKSRKIISTHLKKKCQNREITPALCSIIPLNLRHLATLSQSHIWGPWRGSSLLPLLPFQLYSWAAAWTATRRRWLSPPTFRQQLAPLPHTPWRHVTSPVHLWRNCLCLSVWTPLSSRWSREVTCGWRVVWPDVTSRRWTWSGMSWPCTGWPAESGENLRIGHQRGVF